MDEKNPARKPERSTLKSGAKRLGGAVLNILYPPRCLSCGKPDQAAHPDHSELCVRCKEQLALLLPPFCSRCGESYSGNLTATGFSCGNCANRSYAFDFAIASYEATGLARDLVHRFKYQREFHLRVVLGALLEPALNDLRIADEDDWLMVPVPLHPRRRREREFNQAAEISRIAARQFGIEYLDALKRTRYTTHQAHLDRRDRLETLRGAFAMKNERLAKRLPGQKVLLIDDVFTTGATPHECAAVLRTQGVAKVAAVTIARG